MKRVGRIVSLSSSSLSASLSSVSSSSSYSLAEMVTKLKFEDTISIEDNYVLKWNQRLNYIVLRTL